MRISDIMTRQVVTCRRDARLEDVARLMREHDCGAIPLVESDGSERPIGIVTDRDIVIRALAAGKNPLELTAADCMSSPVTTVKEDASIEEVGRIMAERQLRRVVVVDGNECCRGIVAQADIAEHAPEHETAEVVREVSQPVHH